MSDRFNAVFALESPFRGSRGLFWAKIGRKINVRRGLFFRRRPNTYSRANMEPIWSRVGPFWSQLSTFRRTCVPETTLFVSKISVRRGLFFRHPANTYSRAKIEPIWSRGGPFWSHFAQFWYQIGSLLAPGLQNGYIIQCPVTHHASQQ